MTPRTLFYRKLALVGYIALFVWVILWNAFLHTTEHSTHLIVVALWIVPLLLPAKGLIQGKPYTHAWSNFVVMLYFMHGLTTLFTVPAEIIYAAIELVFATCMFVGCSMYARLRGQELGQGLPKLKEVMEDEKSRFES